MAFDQFDNAERVEALNCGVCLQRERDLAAKLEFVLNNSSVAESAHRLMDRFNESSGSELAAAEVDAVMTGRTVQV